jgi:lysozyme family protein
VSWFDAHLAAVLRHEGGFVNHKDDPGGMTNLGVTRKVWEAWTKIPANEADMRALTIDNVKPLYKARYWDAVRGDELPAGVDYCVFDAAVNSGPTRSAMLLQKALGVSVDGVIGPKTIQAAKVAPPGGLIDALCAKRMEHLRSLPHFRTFGAGWTRRVNEVREYALKMI